ncbi:MMPL family transporter [Phytoactinopolyspora endophytica]|uniref:MMPL family transporter n=1 Tax=Phytoactinopolyspora endophytica TaxID=1642495 RepID=UPI00101C1F92|nr:MMPL family transporter [Phytoactinopolyspora endophytica]
MAQFLYRLSRWGFQRRKTVLAAWLGALVVVSIAGVTLSKETVDEFEIPDTESSQAFDLLEERFPDDSVGLTSAQVVFAVPDGETLTEPGNQAIIEQTVERLATTPGTLDVTSPFEAGTVAEDGSVAFAEVAYGEDPPDDAADTLDDAVTDARDAGLTVEMRGEALEVEGEAGAAELIGLAVAAVVLVITFGSFVAAGLPLLNAVIGVGITIMGIAAATAAFDLASDTSTIAMMLGMALAIDYALFIVSRYRHELAIGHAPLEAVGRAVGTAGSAIVFAGLIVIVALGGLAIFGISFTTQLGLGAAAAVAIAVIIALTLLPAMFGFAGSRIVGGRIPGLRARDPESKGGKPTAGRRWAQFVTRRPAPVLAITAIGLGTLAVPALDMHMAIPDDGTAAEESTAREAYDLVADGFGAGYNGPLTIVIDATDSADPEGAAAHVADVAGQLDNVAAVSPANFNPAGDTATVTVLPETGPSSQETEDLVNALRDEAADAEAATGAALMVTGLTAVHIDFTGTLSDALIPYLAFIVGISMILLMLAFRSILVPIKAALGFLLTISATLGALVAVFQWGWLRDVFGVESTGPIMSFLPVIAIGIVFGLAMDYQIFIGTRMREEHVHGTAPVAAVVNGFQHGARVVTAAAIIMISVFGSFILGEGTIKQVGFALAFAIAVDAFIVRMTIVPAVMALLGHRAWWMPSWLDRLLPDVDVEGEKLRHTLGESADDEQQLAHT